jgi:hypothetical protein
MKNKSPKIIKYSKNLNSDKGLLSQGKTFYKDILIAIALISCTLFVYWPAKYYAFVNYDDFDYSAANQHVQQGLTWPGISWAFTTFYSCNWHPLTWLSLMLDVSILGFSPGSHHIINIVLHLLNTFLLFLILRMITRAFWLSAAIAALFSLHPLHVESVAWISERKDVLCTFFWMITTYCYVQFSRKADWKRYTGTIIAFTFALLSKPMAVTLPFTLLLLDYWPLERMRVLAKDGSFLQVFWQRFIEKTPLFLMSFFSSAITIIAQKTGGATVPFEQIHFWQRIASAAESYLRVPNSLFKIG